jgi:hypothetical protein
MLTGWVVPVVLPLFPIQSISGVAQPRQAV